MKGKEMKWKEMKWNEMKWNEMKGMTVEEKQFTDHESLLLFSALKLNLRYLKNVP